MIRALFGPVRLLFGRFSRSEDGSATIEFAITFPAMLFLMLSGIELGMITLQHSMLERALDMTVRDIRLGTGTAPQHDEIKTMICARSGFIDNCAVNLRLEMIQVDPRNWVPISTEADCTDQSVEVSPVRSFVNGLENELMILRACAKFDPVFPTTGLGKNIAKDAAGQYSLVSTSAFVQEPR
jgi:TadE-like protein